MTISIFFLVCIVPRHRIGGGYYLKGTCSPADVKLIPQNFLYSNLIKKTRIAINAKIMELCHINMQIFTCLKNPIKRKQNHVIARLHGKCYINSNLHVGEGKNYEIGFFHVLIISYTRTHTHTEYIYISDSMILSFSICSMFYNTVSRCLRQLTLSVTNICYAVNMYHTINVILI